MNAGYVIEIFIFNFIVSVVVIIKLDIIHIKEYTYIMSKEKQKFVDYEMFLQDNLNEYSFHRPMDLI